MKKLIFAFCFLITFFTGHAQIKVIAHSGKAGNTNTLTTTAIDDRGATIEFVQIAEYDGVTFGTLSDNQSNTWTQLRVDKVVGNVANYIYYCISPTTSSSHTFTYTKTGSFCAANVIALGNTPTSSPIDQQSGGFVASGTTFQPGAITPGSNNEIIIASMATSNTGGAVSINSGFIISDAIAFGAGVNQGAFMAYFIQPAAASINPTISWPSTAPNAGSQFSVKWVGKRGSFLSIIE